MGEFSWLSDWGPTGAILLLVILMMRTLEKINDGCHQHSERREERLIAALEANSKTFGQLMDYLTKLNGRK